jgi:hypothetical protein
MTTMSTMSLKGLDICLRGHRVIVAIVIKPSACRP